MRLRVNGEEREVSEGLALLDLLATLDVPHQQVAVEVNAEVVRRALHAEYRLKDGDEVEIVAFVGGG